MNQKSRNSARQVSTKRIRDHILDRTLAHVPRWGTTIASRTMSVAEHSFFVARIARRICELLKERKIEVNGEPIKMDVLKVVDMALIHDEEEALTGDIVRTFKKMPEVSHAIEEGSSKLLREQYRHVPDGDYFVGLSEEYKAKQSIEAQIVEVADNLAGLAECDEQKRLGNVNFDQPYKSYSSALGGITYPWFDAIKDVLTFKET